MENEPAKCAAVIGLAINLVHLLASITAPYMPETATTIYKMLRTSPAPIPDVWTADSIKPGHEIGKAEHLFTRILPENAGKWRKKDGSDEASKVKGEEAAMKAKKSEVSKAARTAGNSKLGTGEDASNDVDKAATGKTRPAPR